MSLISASIPNLINGVSQQPPSLRLPTQAELQENALSSVVEGLIKRPPTEHIAQITELAGAENAFIHPIRDENNNTYYVTYTDELRVFDSQGQSMRVQGTGRSSMDYFNGITNAGSQLSAVTVADTTFLLNKNKTVEVKQFTKSPTRAKEALVYIKQGDYKTVYEVRLSMQGQIYTRAVETMSSTQDTSAQVQNAERSIQTDRIAKNLIYGTAKESIYTGGSDRQGYAPDFSDEDYWGGAPEFDYESAGTTYVNTHLNGKISITQYGNVLHYKSLNGEDFAIEVKDSRGNNNIFAFKDVTPDFKKLPPKGPLGFNIKIIGDSSKGQDDYYVALTQDESNEPVWKETLKQNIDRAIDPYTMPHQLKGPYFPEGGSPYWSVGTMPLRERKVGDDDSNPFPSFVGQKLTDVFFHRNRLGLLADENVVFSEAGAFDEFNFFIKTTLTLLDTDVIDVAVSNNRVSLLRHAVPFNESLLLFSDLTQFKLDGAELLTPSTVKIDVTTQFEADLTTKPVGAGKNVFFATKRGEYGGIREYFVNENTETNDAADITSHCPNYLKGNVTHLAASSNEDMLLALTSDDPNSMYVYRYYWNGNEKLQSSWSKWTFTGQVMSAEFNVDKIEMLIKYGNAVYLERISLGEDSAKEFTTGEHEVLLDRRVKVTSLYGLNPYPADNKVFVDQNGTAVGEATAASIVTSSDPDAFVYIGVPYTFRYVFSEFVMKNDKLPITTGRLQLRNLNVVYDNTGHFETVVTPHLRTPVVNTFNGRRLDAATNLIGRATIDTGSFKFGVLGNSTDTKIELRSDSHLPCRFQSAEWEGFFKLRSRRM